MIVNNQYINEEYVSEEGRVIQNAKLLLENQFGITGFGQIYLHGKRAIIEETTAVVKLCEEDKSRRNSYWLGKKKKEIRPGDIDPEKQIVIANLDMDVPICMDFRTREINPPIIYLSNQGWEEICDSHEGFIRTLNECRIAKD